jgi:ABC-type nickel/cobalt efflux system permease component RcnA
MRNLSRLFCALVLSGAPLLAWQAVPSDGHDAVRQKLEALLRVSDPTAGFLAVALGVAFLAGAAHALTPGHGKALVAAYLAGSRGTVSDAVYLGAVVTVTHTASVFVLGLIALYASQHIQMERIFHWLSLFSGALIVAIGASLLWSRWQALRSGVQEGHEHDHSHGHSHGIKDWLTYGHSHAHGHEHGHDHDHDHVHGHNHTHPHDHVHSHDHGHSHGHQHSHTHGHEHGHDLDHVHTPPPDAANAPTHARVGRGSLLSLGISGGLVPCPEAMVVLLISITINRLLFGLVILLAFSLGLAAVLIAIGIAMVLAGPALSKFSKEGMLMRAVPVGSAALVTLLGVAILYSAAVDAGLFP